MYSSCYVIMASADLFGIKRSHDLHQVLLLLAKNKTITKNVLIEVMLK